MIWARMLAYITGSVDQELLLRNEYLAAENWILRAKIKAACFWLTLKSHAGRNCTSSGAQGPGRCGSFRQARYPVTLVPRTDRPRSLMDQDSASLWDDLSWMRKSSVWWCEWQERI